MLRRKHSAARSRPGGNKALLTPEPMVRLDVASSNVRGGFFPNIGSTGSDAGRYQGAIAEKAVPFPSVARRSQFFPAVRRGAARRGRWICVACFVSTDSAMRGHLSGGSTAYHPAMHVLAFDRFTNSIDFNEPTIACFGVETIAQSRRPRTAGSLRFDSTCASAVQAAEEPDQKNDRDRNSDQPQQ